MDIKVDKDMNISSTVNIASCRVCKEISVKNITVNNNILSANGTMVYRSYAGEYEGDYTIIPATSEQVLSTEKKIMKSDLVVKEIPYFDTSNNSGGTTVYIGGVVETTTIE